MPDEERKADLRHVSPLEPQLRAAVALTTRPGGYAVLAGAGLSRSAGVKTAWEVLLELVERVAAAGGDRPDDPVRWWTDRTGNEPTYPMVLEQLASTQDERRALLAEFFERTDSSDEQNRSPSPAHRAIAALVRDGFIRLVVTTNFDLLMEEALRDEGVEPITVSTPAAIEQMEPLHAQAAAVLHLHGDYLNPGVLNTAEELNSYSEAVERRVRQVIEEYGLLVVGWSAQWDNALAGLMADASKPRYSSWWIEPSELNPVQTRLMQTRPAEHIPATADEGLSSVLDAVTALVDWKDRSSPLAASSAVAAAKRELSGTGPAIRTHDRLKAELDRVQSSSAVSPRTYDGGAAEGRERERDLVAVGQPLWSLVAALAYWGTDETDRWWFPSIERFAARPHASGTTGLIHLSRSAATLVLYAGGVAAAAAERWELVSRLLTEPMTESHTGGELLPVSLALHPGDVGLSQGVRTVFHALSDAFTIHLGLDNVSYAEAWERFEYMHHLSWADARIRDVGGTFGDAVGWAPHLRCEGIGPAESRPTPDLWFERVVLESDKLHFNEWLPRGNRQNARRQFLTDYASYADRADHSLLPVGRAGMLPSGRHVPGRFDADLFADSAAD